MDARAIVDTGFIVALLDRDDEHHAWAATLRGRLRGPWATAEACVSETVFLLDGDPAGVRHLLEMLRLGLLRSQHFLPEELAGIARELTGYRRRRVDFADACLVTLSDRRPDLPLATTDNRDFAVYLRGRSARTLHTP